MPSASAKCQCYYSNIRILIFIYSLTLAYTLIHTAVPAEENGDLQTLICVLVARPHIVESCSLTNLNGGLSRLHSADEDAVSWLTSYG